MLLLVLAQAAASSLLEIPVPPTRARPTFGALLSAADYPREAARRGWEGNVVADLTISPEGRVSACKIVTSSGHGMLDDATCRIMLKRAKFRPASDKQGRPVADTLRTPAIEWRVSR
jgi:protein TonB